MLRYFYTALAALCCCAGLIAQNKSEVKNFPRGYSAGEVNLLQQWTETDGVRSFTIYKIEIPVDGSYSIATVSNLQKGTVMPISIDGKTGSLQVNAQENGWQKSVILNTDKSNGNYLFLAAGIHTIKLSLEGNMPPLVDEISFSRSTSHPQLEADWSRFAGQLAQWELKKPTSNVPAADKYSSIASKVLNNPEGNYEHAIDTAFNYSTFQWVYLVAGTTYTFTTSGSTVDPVLHLFDPQNIDIRSWSADDYNGTWESNLVVTVPVTATYALLARPYYASQSGTTNITQNGAAILTATPIAGQRFLTNVRTGNLNYFTARLTGVSSPDTRIFTFPYSSGPANGYNDDYANSSGGTWAWGLASRIKKNYSSGCSIVFVSAYSTTRNGSCDLYMGNVAATLPTSGEAANFPSLKGEDAIQTAPGSGSYNCIAWSGGITTSWIWPPDAFSTWHVNGNDLAGFDKYYSNTPVRYPGAWNYTRTGATVANSVVDLWKTASAYTHASVTKPGNDNPHGYDWESKPGGFDRTLHPRNALQNANWYGSVSSYYKFAGTYAWNIFQVRMKINSDEDAIKAGLAVLDRASLTTASQSKLQTLKSKIDPDFERQFEELYNAWDKTKVLNASLSDPSAYCRNAEFEKLAALGNKNSYAMMLLVFDKFVNGGDHYLSQLVQNLTLDKYSRLLTEVKAERAAAPNDAMGRYKIHGDHDNGVLYIEKILKQLEEPVATSPVDETIMVSVSPNPVKDQFTVLVNLKATANVSVQAVSAQSRITRQLQAEKELPAGTHRFNATVSNLGSSKGDIIAVQVRINGVLHTAKVLVL